MAEKREATDSEKAGLTKASQEAVNLSLNLPIAALPAADALAMGINAQLDNVFIPFEGSGSEVANTATNIALGPLFGLIRALTQEKWDSSQTIRANCQAARSNVKSRTGQVDRRLMSTQKDVSLLDQTASNVASPEFVNDVQRRAQECMRDPLKCAADPTASLWESFWRKIPLSAKIVGGFAIVGMTMFYVGPIIRAGGMLVSKVAGNKKKKSKRG